MVKGFKSANSAGNITACALIQTNALPFRIFLLFLENSLKLKYCNCSMEQAHANMYLCAQLCFYLSGYGGVELTVVLSSREVIVLARWHSYK
jgi:hypothetical protein